MLSTSTIKITRNRTKKDKTYDDFKDNICCEDSTSIEHLSSDMKNTIGKKLKEKIDNEKNNKSPNKEKIPLPLKDKHQIKNKSHSKSKSKLNKK